MAVERTADELGKPAISGVVDSAIRDYVSTRFGSSLPSAIMAILSLMEKGFHGGRTIGATADPKRMEMQMSIVETLHWPLAGTNSSARIHVRRAAARQTETRANECGSDTTGAELPARAIEERVSAVLRSSSYHPVRHVSCEVSERVLVLRGRVPSFYLKQVVQTVVRDLLSDGLVIDNRVEVDRTSLSNL